MHGPQDSLGATDEDRIDQGQDQVWIPVPGAPAFPAASARVEALAGTGSERGGLGRNVVRKWRRPSQSVIRVAGRASPPMWKVIDLGDPSLPSSNITVAAVQRSENSSFE